MNRALTGSKRVSVWTGARIHLGFYGLCTHGDLRLGGVGLSVDGVGYKITVEVSNTVTVEGCQADRALGYVSKAARAFGIEGLRVKLHECIPPHVGLGSTTQLILALYASAAILAGYSVEEAAIEAVKRSRRESFSGVGKGAFVYGGLVIDTGVRRGTAGALPAAYARVPEHWRVIAILPKTGWRIEEEEERGVIMRIVEKKESQDLCCKAYSALMRMVLPGIAFNDFDLFARGVEEIDRITGEYFGDVQGGLYCCKESEDATRLLSKLGARGVGQSSWGPLVYGFYEDESKARKALEEAKRIIPNNWTVYMLRPRNVGARISVS